MLLVITLFWGLSFLLTKQWLNAAAATGCPGGEGLATLTLIALRMGLAFGLLAVFQPRLIRAPDRREVAVGALLGGLNFLGTALQVWGLAETSPAFSAFFTSLASAWVPLLVFVGFGVRVRRLTLLGLGMAVAGAAVLAQLDSQTEWKFNRGDRLNVLASVFFAVVIVLVDRLGRHTRPGHLTGGFFAGMGLPALVLATAAAAGGPGLGPWLAWASAMLQDPAVLTVVGLLTVLCTVLTFHWMTVYQPRVAASRAALIYLLEPVFAALFSTAAGQDGLTRRLLVGGGLILGGNLLAELPGWLQARDQRRAAGCVRAGCLADQAHEPGPGIQPRGD
jgi:drug/metabolite transporter (DMT)-like permease